MLTCGVWSGYFLTDTISRITMTTTSRIIVVNATKVTASIGTEMAGG